MDLNSDQPSTLPQSKASSDGQLAEQDDSGIGASVADYEKINVLNNGLTSSPFAQNNEKREKDENYENDESDQNILESSPLMKHSSVDIHFVLPKVNSVTANFDENIVADPRFVKNYLEIEDKYIARKVVDNVQQCPMYAEYEKNRMILVEWLHQVCGELECEELVFPSAVNYLDRYIEAKPDVPKNQLQLLGVVCLLIASKIRQFKYITIQTLCYYTGYSITKTEVQEWEKLVLMTLQYDLSAVLAGDYVAHILMRLKPLLIKYGENRSQNSQKTGEGSFEGRENKRGYLYTSYKDSKHFKPSSPDGGTEFNPYKESGTMAETLAKIAKHANTLICLCVMNSKYICVKPSVLAAASVTTAIRGIFKNTECVNFPGPILSLHRKSRRYLCDEYYYQELLSMLENILGVDANIIERNVASIENLIEKEKLRSI